MAIVSADYQDHPTETETPTVTETVQSTESPLPPETETATPILESPTSTLTPIAETEETETDLSVTNLDLSGEFVTNEILVRFRRRSSRDSIVRCIQAINATILAEIDELNAVVLLVTDGKLAESIQALSSCPDIRYAEPNYLVEIADVIPTDPGWGYQYGLMNIHAPQGWGFTTGSSSVTIAILDTGIDLSHADLAGKIVNGYDFVWNDSIAQDDNGHGTHVAGIAGAVSDNGRGMAGVSWGARLMPVKVLNASGNGTYAQVANGIIWAADHGAQVINLSLGGSSPSQVLQDAVDYAVARGVILVAASGNTGRNLVLYPAHYPNVIAVGATDSSNARASFSNYGPELDLAAPGVSIYSTAPGGYGYRNGTSMAAPFVSGLAAILRGIPGNNSIVAIEQQMEGTALDLGSMGWDDFHGHGLIQMDAAIRLAWPTPTPANTPEPSIRDFTTSFAPLPTFTPSATQTVSSLLTDTQVILPPASKSVTPAEPPVETPEVIALSAELPADTGTADRLLPMCGFTLLLMGFMLLWMSIRERRRGRAKVIFFR